MTQAPPSPAPILAFDSSGPHVAAALIWPGEASPRHSRHEEMARGQAERLMPILQELLAEAGLEWSDLGGLAVGVGPGNFTGIRIAVAGARGLALGLGKPVVGLSSFALMHAGADAPAHCLISLPAPRDQVYLQAFLAGEPAGAPQLSEAATPEIALPWEAEQPFMVIGAEAETIAAAFSTSLGQPVAAMARSLEPLTERLATLGAACLARHVPGQTPRPAPLYVRPADAAPPSDPPPIILDA